MKIFLDKLDKNLLRVHIALRNASLFDLFTFFLYVIIASVLLFRLPKLCSIWPLLQLGFHLLKRNLHWHLLQKLDALLYSWVLNHLYVYSGLTYKKRALLLMFGSHRR